MQSPNPHRLKKQAAKKEAAAAYYAAERNLYYLQGVGTINPSRYTGRGMGADILHKYIKLYLILIFMLRCTNHTFIEKL